MGPAHSVPLSVPRSSVLLNAFDVDPGAAERSLELRCGELFSLPLQVDLLVVSAYAGNYEPVPGTLVARLWETCGLALDALPRAFDLSAGPVGAWVSPPLASLATAPTWPQGSSTRFARIAVVESPATAAPPSGSAELPAWPAFNQLFCLLALLPLHGIACRTVATPLLSAGNQGVQPQRLFPALLERCRDGFRHVPDLERMVIFDRQRQPLQQLAERIDRELQRSPSQRQLLDLAGQTLAPRDLLAALESFSRRHPELDLEGDVAELMHQLGGLQTTAVALGLHGRRLVEGLVRQRLGWRRGTLYQGLQVLTRQEVNPWILSCLHQVRVFCNWMGHPSRNGSRRAVSPTDVAAMLAALQRVLEDYPW